MTVVGCRDRTYPIHLQTVESKTPAEGIVVLWNCSRLCV